MALTVHATYENGILKPAEPLPLKEHEQVQVIGIRKPSLAEQTAGLIGWKGDAETFERLLAEAEESGIHPLSRVRGRSCSLAFRQGRTRHATHR